MRKLFIYLTLTFSFSLFFIKSEPELTIQSLSFEYGSIIPQSFSYEESNQIPQFVWMNVPLETESFVFTVKNVDTSLYHWIVINIPKTVRRIGFNSINQGKEIINSFNVKSYVGPSQNLSGTNQFEFVIYALRCKKIFANNIEQVLKNIQMCSIIDSEYKGLFLNYVSI